jgi:hypothetical protein
MALPPFPNANINKQAQRRLKDAHDLVEQFRRDKTRHLEIIREMLATGKLTTADKLEEPNQDCTNHHSLPQ